MVVQFPCLKYNRTVSNNHKTAQSNICDKWPALAYEACDSMCKPPHIPKTSETCYITHTLHYKNVFQTCGV